MNVWGCECVSVTVCLCRVCVCVSVYEAFSWLIGAFVIFHTQPAEVNIAPLAPHPLFPGALLITGRGGRLGTHTLTIPLAAVMSVRFVHGPESVPAFRVTDSAGTSAVVTVKPGGDVNALVTQLACAVVLRRALSDSGIADSAG